MYKKKELGSFSQRHKWIDKLSFINRLQITCKNVKTNCQASTEAFGHPKNSVMRVESLFNGQKLIKHGLKISNSRYRH